MGTQMPLFPEQASTAASKVDTLFLFLLALTGSVAIGVTVMIVFYTIRYRRRDDSLQPPRIMGSLRLESLWSAIPLVIFLGIFIWGAKLYYSMASAPENALEIYVVGKQWMWKIQHPEGQREINELHVPMGRPVKLTLTSEDVIHDFFVPAFRTKVDVLPGRYVHTWFQATQPGEYHLFCAQYCGTNHAGMIGKIVVQTPSDYQAWLNSHAEGSLALQGRKLFLKFQCVTCHSADSQARAPVLGKLYGRQVHLQDGSSVVADDQYIRESILKPEARIVAGWQPIMPTFQGQVTEEDILQLLAFIKALEPGQTPERTEEATAPTKNSLTP